MGTLSGDATMLSSFSMHNTIGKVQFPFYVRKTNPQKKSFKALRQSLCRSSLFLPSWLKFQFLAHLNESSGRAIVVTVASSSHFSLTHGWILLMSHCR